MSRFQVALSFPGEYRPRVERIAEALAARLSRDEVLYDHWHAAELNRANLDVYLPRLYHEESELIAVFLCQEYNAKEWCGLEWRACRDLLKRKKDERLMFFRLDDADIPGLYSIDGYQDIRRMTDLDVAAAILQRLQAPSAPGAHHALPSRESTVVRAVIEGELKWVLRDASRRLGRSFDDWQQLSQLLVPARVARGLRPLLTQVEYEELERRRRAGDYSGLNHLERERDKIAEEPVDLREVDVQNVFKRSIATWEQVRDRIGRAVILGDPGYGKTVLLWGEVGRRNNEGLSSSESRSLPGSGALLAVFFRAVELALDRPTTWSFLQRVTEVLSQRHGLAKEDEHIVIERISSGACLIAVDALDEVPAQWRIALEDRLRDFAFQCPRSPILLSSRLVDYTGAPIPIPSENELEVLAFDESQMQRAVGAWFAPDTASARDLWQHITAHSQIRSLLRCPLLMRLACQMTAGSAKRPQATPGWERRSDLYEAFLADSIVRWADKAEFRPSREQRALFLSFAGDLAFRLWLKDSHRTLWAQSVVASEINRLRPRYGALSSRPDLLGDLCLSGVLSLAGPETPDAPLMFTHRTFGEYLTARAIADTLASEHNLQIWNLLSRKSWDTDWEEVIRFVIGQLEVEGVSRLLQELSNAANDDIFRHRLALAARCLTEIAVEYRDAVSPILNRITQEAIELWWTYATRGADAVVEHITRALSALAVVNGQIGGTTFLQWLADQLSDPNDLQLSTAAKAVESIGVAAGTRSICEGLGRLLENNHRGAIGAISSLRACAEIRCISRIAIEMLQSADPKAAYLGAEAMRSLGPAAVEPQVLKLLMEMLSHPNREFRMIATYAIGGLGTVVGSAFLDVLLQFLSDERGIWQLGNLQMAAIEAIRELNHTFSSDLLDQLAQMLSHGRGSTRLVAIKTIEALGSAAATPTLLDHLNILLHDPRPGVRMSAAKAVDAVRQATPDICECLIQLTSDEHVGVRAAALRALGAAGGATPVILGRLMECLGDEAAWVRMASAQALNEIRGSVPVSVVGDRLNTLLDDKDEYVRMAAAQATVLIRHCTEAGLSERLVVLLFDKEPSVVMAAVRAIDSLREKKAVARVLDKLVQLLDDNGWQLSRATAMALGSAAWAGATPKILDHLEHILTKENDPLHQRRMSYIDWNALWAVARMGRVAATPVIVKRLIELLDEGDWSSPRTIRALMLDGVRIFKGAIVSNASELAASR